MHRPPAPLHFLAENSVRVLFLPFVCAESGGAACVYWRSQAVEGTGKAISFVNSSLTQNIASECVDCTVLWRHMNVPV